MVETRDRRVLKIALLAITFGLPGIATHAQYGGGTGEPNDPYLIFTATQLNAIGVEPNDWDKYFRLMANIDLSTYKGTDFNIIGRGWISNGWPNPFRGVFDGNGHTISRFTWTTTGKACIGLFAYVDGPTAEIKNVRLADVSIDGGNGHSIGALVGTLNRGKVTNCQVIGRVHGDMYVGGLVGYAWYEGHIVCCRSDGIVSGTTWTGGLVGYDLGGSIINCCSGASVEGHMWVGGLVGSVSAGRIAGCYATGDVSGDEHVGGLAGTITSGAISTCHSIGSVLGNSHVGGLVGSGNPHCVIRSFWDVETSTQTTSTGGVGKSTATMQTADTFLGWATCDSPEAWTIQDGRDYPRLWWENQTGQVIRIMRLSDCLAGTGTEEDPFLIHTAHDMNLIGLFPCEWSKHFKLMADIDLSQYVETDFNIIGHHWTTAGSTPFAGVFDGNGHAIMNFTRDNAQTSGAGLFGYVAGLRTGIRNLTLVNPRVIAVDQWDVGPLVGYLNKGTIRNCGVISGIVSGSHRVGGLLGGNYGTIVNCYSISAVAGNVLVGGLVGENSSRGGGAIMSSYSAGRTAGDNKVGGLAGGNGGVIADCYARGRATGISSTGGLVGQNWGLITACYSTGAVNASTDVGGLAGLNGAGIVGSFYDVESSGQITSNGGTGKSTVEMQMVSTFLAAGWDFVGEAANGMKDIWRIREGQDYPRLSWEPIAGP